MVSDDWVLGLTEGEGCFSIAMQLYTDKRPRKNPGKQNTLHVRNPACGIRVNPSFRINLRWDDVSVLEKIRDHMGVGVIYYHKRTKYGPSIQDTAEYCVQGVEHLKTVRAFFEKLTFIGKKGNDFRLWSECLHLIEQKRHLEKSGLLRICEIRDLMNFRANKGNRLREEIEKIFSERRQHIAAHQNPFPNPYFIHNKNSSNDPTPPQ